MRHIRNQLMYVPVLIFYFSVRKTHREHYILFKQLAYKKWFPIQWRLLDGVMQVYPETEVYEPELKEEYKDKEEIE